MRRKDREMPEEFGWMVADRCPWAVLAMTGPDGLPYCLPLSMAREGRALYFHCAPEGEKTACLRARPRVCVSCVGDARLVPEEFSTEYESAVLRGVAREVTDEGEKRRALELICLRYAPSNMGSFEEALAKSMRRTAVWRIDVESVTAKRKKYDAQGKEMKFGRME